MNFNMMISGLSGAIVGGLSYFVLSAPSYAGGTGEGLGQYLLWFFALATVASLLAAAYGCIANDKATQVIMTAPVIKK
jgi:4-hydroxybenzoate polyprenyltransferase